MLIYWMFLQFVGGITSVVAEESGGVAFWAHVGGFVAGVVLVKVFVRRDHVGLPRVGTVVAAGGGLALISVLLYALLCFVWGSTWLVIKIGYGGLGPFNVAALRFFVAGALFAPLIWLFRARWPRGREEWLLVWWVGLMMFAGDYGLIYWGEQFLDSGLTAILFATLPLITILFAHVYLPGEPITLRKLTGTLVAFFGVAGLFGDRVRLDAAQAGPMLAIVASAVCAATVGVASKRHGSALHPAALNAPAMIGGAFVLMAVSLAVGDGFTLPRDAATWRCHRVSRDCWQRPDVLDLLHAAQDMECDEPELYQCLHAGHRFAARVRVSR